VVRERRANKLERPGRLRAWFEYQGIYYAGSNIPRLEHNWPSVNCSRYTRNYCYGSCYTEGYESNATDAYNTFLARSAKAVGDFAPSSDPTYCAGRGRERRRHAGEAASLCVREFDRDGWQASVRRNVAPPASVSLGAAGENAFAVVVPDADCE